MKPKRNEIKMRVSRLLPLPACHVRLSQLASHHVIEGFKTVRSINPVIFSREDSYETATNYY